MMQLVKAGLTLAMLFAHHHKQPPPLVAPQLPPIQFAEASWYEDGGSTACGFHAGMGVANKELACGTKVTFYYNGRSVTAEVDDRGPYVYPRVWDLNQNVAGALGFGGVTTVGYRILK